MTTVGSLRSTGVTPFPRYYGPLRIPPIQLTGLWIPLPPPGYKPQTDGPLRFLGLSFAARCPLPPRWADPLLVLIASRIVLASSSSGDWPPTTCVSRPNPVQPYGLRLTASLSDGLPPSPGFLGLCSRLDSTSCVHAVVPWPASLPVLRYLHTTGRSYMY